MGLTRFALLVTATVDDVEQLPQAAETVDQLGRASRVRLRARTACSRQRSPRPSGSA